MSKIVRYQFMGNWAVFAVLWLLIITLPLAILYLINSTVRLDSEVPDPEKFVDEFMAGKLTRQ